MILECSFPLKYCLTNIATPLFGHINVPTSFDSCSSRSRNVCRAMRFHAVTRHRMNVGMRARSTVDVPRPPFGAIHTLCARSYLRSRYLGNFRNSHLRPQLEFFRQIFRTSWFWIVLSREPIFKPIGRISKID